MIKNMKVLVVAYYFYPCDMIGAKRSSYLAEFLAQKGLKITVLKADNENYFNRIDFKLNVNPRIKFINVNNSIKLKSFRESIFWYLSFKRKMQVLIKKDTYDLIYFSGDPFFYFSLGSFFSKKYNINYILDFRDIWVSKPIIKLNWKGNIVQYCKNYLEKKAIKTAKLVIHCTESRTKMYQEKYLYFDINKFITVFNGFDESKVPILTKTYEKEKNVLKLGIFGKFYYYNSEHAAILLESLKKLKQTTNIMIYHVGKKEQEFSDMVLQNNLDENFEFVGYKNYTDGLEILNTMDFLILNNRAHFELGTKIYDYLYLNKPILAFINEKSDIWRLLSRFRNTFLIQSSEDFISGIGRLKETEDYTVIGESEIMKFTRKYQMEYLYSELVKLKLLW